MGGVLRMRGQALEDLFAQTYELIEFLPNKVLFKEKNRVLPQGFEWPNVYDNQNLYINMRTIPLTIDLGNCERENRERFYRLNPNFLVKSCECRIE